LIRFRAAKFETHSVLSDIDVFDPERREFGPAQRRRETEEKDRSVPNPGSGLREGSRHCSELLDRKRPLPYRRGPEHAPQPAALCQERTFAE
jgi:hypothetical protein